ncbi:MAG: tetratricopeptide repeat protein [Candidatus Thiodiazotropha sp.]
MSNNLYIAEKKLSQGKPAEAHKLLSRILKKEPHNRKAALLMGESLLLQERVDESLPFLMQAVADGQGEPCWFVSCGLALEKKGQYADAEKSYQLAERSGCTEPRMYYLIGNFHTNITRNYAKAEVYYANLISLSPDAQVAYLALSRLYILQERYEESIQALDHCLQNGFETVEVYINLAHALAHQGRQSDALDCNRRALQIDPDHPIAIQNYLTQMLYTEDDQAVIYRELRKIVAPFNKQCVRRHKGAIDCTPGRKLKLGFVSADLRQHAIAHYFLPIVERLDQERFSLNFYYNNLIHDPTTERIRAFSDSWCECLHYTDDQLAQQIRKDRIDILIDLSNHTVGNRLSVFNRRPAPLQISWLGLPVSTGLDCIDYAIKDRQTIDICKLDENASETMLPVESLNLYYPFNELPPLSPAPCQNNGYITFGSFNVLRKIDRRILEVWAKLLRRLPTARLRMVIEDYNNPTMQDYLYELFTELGAAREQIILKPSLPMNEYMLSHNEVDIALDPYPYHGQTTTYNALMMGVPVISCCGRSIASNLSRRILGAIGRQAWIAENFDEYLDKAVSLAEDQTGLAQIREQLRAQVEQSSIMDFASAAAGIEAALQQGWELHCQKNR